MIDQTAGTRVTVPCQFCGTLNRVDLGRLDRRPVCGDCAKPILLDRPLRVEEDQFEATVLRSPVPVVVDFYADWCAPCRLMAPVVDEIAGDARGRLLVVKVDTDRAPALTRRYGIRGIPFFGRFEGGELAQTAVGAVGRGELRELARIDDTPTSLRGDADRVER